MAEEASEFDAAIAPQIAAERYTLDVLANEIEDTQDAVTRLLVVHGPLRRRGRRARTRHRSSRSIRDDHPGALLEILDEFAVRGVNLTRIESRPTGDGIGRYCFSIDCEGHVAEARVGEALMGLRRVCADVRFLGSYPRAYGARITLRLGTSDDDFATAASWLTALKEGRSRPGSRAGCRTRGNRTRATGSDLLDAELVALRVLHHDPVLAEGTVPLVDRTGARLLEPLHHRGHETGALLAGVSRPPPALMSRCSRFLPCSGLRHPLQEDPRPVAVGVDDRGLVVPAFLGDPVVAGKVLLGVEPLGWRLDHAQPSASAQNCASRPGSAASMTSWMDGPMDDLPHLSRTTACRAARRPTVLPAADGLRPHGTGEPPCLC